MRASTGNGLEFLFKMKYHQTGTARLHCIPLLPAPPQPWGAGLASEKGRGGTDRGTWSAAWTGLGTGGGGFAVKAVQAAASGKRGKGSHFWHGDENEKGPRSGRRYKIYRYYRYAYYIYTYILHIHTDIQRAQPCCFGTTGNMKSVQIREV